MIDDICAAVQQHNLAKRMFLRSEIYSVCANERGRGWRVAGISRNAGDFVVSTKIVALCTSRRLGAPRNIQYPGEDRYRHYVCRGLAGDNVAAPWKGAQVLILGMGAFAVEQIRTGFEHGAARVRILCRRHGLVCPQMIDYMNYIRPIEADTYDHPVSGSGMMVGLWQRSYALAGATPPECWANGQFRPDGHTVSVSDLYFIGHFLGALDTRQGVVKAVDVDGVWTDKGQFMACTVMIKSLGFEIQEGNGHSHSSDSNPALGPTLRRSETRTRPL